MIHDRWLVKKLFGVGVLIALLTAVPAGGWAIEDRLVIPLDEVGTAQVDIRLGAGEVFVSGGAVDLVEADFRYSSEHWKPEITQSRSNGRTQVSIEQGSSVFSFFQFGPIENRWNVFLNNQVPIDLEVKLGAGKADLKMGWLNLSSLNVKGGAGEMILDLTGSWSRNCRIDLEMGVGSLQVLLPADTGARVEVHTGLGRVDLKNMISQGDVYVNRAYQNSPVTLEINLRSGVGQVSIEG